MIIITIRDAYSVWTTIYYTIRRGIEAYALCSKYNIRSYYNNG